MNFLTRVSFINFQLIKFVFIYIYVIVSKYFHHFNVILNFHLNTFSCSCSGLSKIYRRHAIMKAVVFVLFCFVFSLIETTFSFSFSLRSLRCDHHSKGYLYTHPIHIPEMVQISFRHQQAAISGQVVLECYRIVSGQLVMEIEPKVDKDQSCTKLLSTSSIDF